METLFCWFHPPQQGWQSATTAVFLMDGGPEIAGPAGQRWASCQVLCGTIISASLSVGPAYFLPTAKKASGKV